MQQYCVHAQGHPPIPMVGQYLASLPTHLQEGVQSCKGYLFLPVLPLVQLNTPWRLHQLQLCPSGEQLRKEVVGRGFSAQCECREGRELMLGMEGGRQTDRHTEEADRARVTDIPLTLLPSATS